MGDPVLVIDDEWRLLAALRERLIAAGYVVYATLSAKDGLFMAGRYFPKVILLDICMPGMDGYEFCRCLRNEAEISRTPVVAISAITHDSVRHAILEAGATCFVSKPYVTKELLQIIDKLIRYHDGASVFPVQAEEAL